MGVKGLYSYLRQYMTRVLDSTPTQPMRIGFDAMSMIYKYKADYHQIFPLLERLQGNGHTIIFVFDGKPPATKEGLVKERRDVRQGAIAQAKELKAQLETAELSTDEQRILKTSIARLETQGWHLSREIRLDFQRELMGLSIPYVQALGEADMALVDLCAARKLDVVVSTDMDFLLSGVPRLWIPFRRTTGPDVSTQEGFEQIVTQSVLVFESITQEGLRDAGILCGVEALRGKLHMNSHTAFSWIRHYKSIEGVLQSSIKNPQLDCLREPGVLEAVRQGFEPQGPWNKRIRPDHVERFKEFLTLL
jgi:5'-3' exonuclease